MRNLLRKLPAVILPVFPTLDPEVQAELRAVAKLIASNIRAQKSSNSFQRRLQRQQLIVCALHSSIPCEGADARCRKWRPLHMALALRSEKIELAEICDGIRRFLDSPLHAASGCQRCAAFREDFRY